MRWDVARALERAHDLPRLSVFETLYRGPAWHHIERGTGDPAEWQRQAHRALEARAGRPLPPLHDEWRRAQGVIAANVELVRALRPEFKVSVLSNADASLRRRLETELGIHDLFDDVVCSAEVGMAKPEAAVFRLAASRLGLAPAECVFVDDAAENVAAARAVGMTALHYRAHRGDDLRAGLRDVGAGPSA